MDNNMIEILREYFKTQPVEKAWIFGSFSRGEERSDSDVDIMIAITNGAQFSLLDHSGMICNLTPIKTPKEIILELIRNNPKVTIQHMVEAMGMNKRNAQKHVHSLVEDNQIRRIGPARGGYWEIIP